MGNCEPANQREGPIRTSTRVGRQGRRGALRLQGPRQGRCATKLIEAHSMTAANVHDSGEETGLIGSSDALRPLFLDAGYEGRERDVK